MLLNILKILEKKLSLDTEQIAISCFAYISVKLLSIFLYGILLY